MDNSIFSIDTKSGGLIELFMINDRFSGQQLVLHVDQTANINNGDDECNIIIDDNEVKDLISLLNGYLTNKYGIPHVILAEYLANPAITVDIKELAKNISVDEDVIKNKIDEGIKIAIANPNNNINEV